jgi:hypothetical protein
MMPLTASVPSLFARLVAKSQLLRALPRDKDLVVRGVGFDRCCQPDPLLVGEVLRAGVEDGMDRVERVALAVPMLEGVLLHSATDLVDGRGAGLDHVEGIHYCGRVLQLVVDSFGPPPARIDVMQDVLIVSGRGHVLEPGLVRGESFTSSSSTARHTVFYDVPNCRRGSSMVACSRRSCPTARKWPTS